MGASEQISRWLACLDNVRSVLIMKNSAVALSQRRLMGHSEPPAAHGPQRALSWGPAPQQEVIDSLA
eukprot:scaffold455030_cov18-Prasinocladus_malaysianus.AAC.1